MKLIYYHLFKAISKIDMDKQTEWKALSVLSVLLLFNIISGLRLIFILSFNENIFINLNANKLYWLLFGLIIYGVCYIFYGKKDKSNKIINFYSSNKRYNSFLAMSITVTYIIVTFILVYFSTRV